MFLSLFTIVYATVSGYLYLHQRNGETDQLGFSYNDVVKEKRYYTVALSLFEHRTILQLISDIFVFLCSDYSSGNTGLRETLFDVLFFAFLICSLHLLGISFSADDSDIRDRHVCGFYGLNTYRALENSLLFLSTEHPLSGNIFMLLVNIASFIALQIGFPREYTFPSVVSVDAG